MTRTGLVVAAGVVLLLSAGAETIRIDDAPFGRFRVVVPVFPERDYPITDFGAKPDGAKCTEAIKDAIASCSRAGGGRVVFPKGTWVTGAIHLKSGVDLHLDDGAVVAFTDDPADYPVVHTTWEGVECLNYSPLVFAYGCTNVAITGGGLLRPKMDRWRSWFDRPPAHMYATECLYHWCSTNAPMTARDVTAIRGSHVRPHLLQINRCQNVLLDGFRVRESPFWTIHLYLSRDCVVRNLKTYAHGHNNDGVDVDMSQDVLIENCSFDQGDDGIVLKAGRNRDAWRLNTPTERIVVRNCDLNNSHSLLGIGSELSGGIRDVWMHDCRVGATYRGLNIKTNRRRGGFVENVYLENCQIGEVINVVNIATDVLYQWAKFPDYELRYTAISNINVRGLSVSKAETAVKLKGDWHLPPKDIRLQDISVGAVQEKFVDIDNCEGVELERVRLRVDGGKARFTVNRLLPVSGKIAEMSAGHRRAAEFFSRSDFAQLLPGVYQLGEGAVAKVEDIRLTPYDACSYLVDETHDRFYGMVQADGFECFRTGAFGQVNGLWHDEFVYIPAGQRFADGLSLKTPCPEVRHVLITVEMCGAK